MFWWPVNAVNSFVIALLFIQSLIESYCQAQFGTFSYSLSGIAPLPTHPMGYTQPLYHLPQDKTEVIVVGGDRGDQHHHHHHHHHHKHGHHHHHGHQHSHDHNHNHDHKHDHDHQHGHNHNHKHDHSHDHKHDHGHKHLHNHAHGHLHNHGHIHDHKHALLLLHRHRQKHNHKRGLDYQQNANHNNNLHHQNNGNGYDQQVNYHQKDQEYNNQQQDHIGSQHSSQLPPFNQQQYDNQHISNNYEPNNLQHNNYDSKFPDHVPPSYVSTNNNNGSPHHESHNKIQQGHHNLKVYYDEPAGENQSHNEHSTSNENTSYEPLQEDNNNPQDEHSHSNENPLYNPEIKHDEDGIADGSKPQQGGVLVRSPNSNFNSVLSAQQRTRALKHGQSYNPRLRNSNTPNGHNKYHQLNEGQQSSEELILDRRVQYGVRVGQNGYDDYHNKESSISAVTFLQENGDIVTVGDDDDPFLSVERPLKLESDNTEGNHHRESLESKLSSGRVTLTSAEDYKASFGKIDEVWNVPLFD